LDDEGIDVGTPKHVSRVDARCPSKTAQFQLLQGSVEKLLE
jgi:hypothetical protein